MAMNGASLIVLDDRVRRGQPVQVLDTLVRSVAQTCSIDSSVKKMYIGQASGQNWCDALKRRNDKYKKEEGINHFVALYESESERNIDAVEGGLITYFDSHKCKINRTTKGGQGRASAQDHYYVYVPRDEALACPAAWPKL